LRIPRAGGAEIANHEMQLGRAQVANKPQA
jgi:hypothetical protein